MFPSVPRYESNVRGLWRLLDRQQTQTGARPCGQEEEELVHCVAERHGASDAGYALMWPFISPPVRGCNVKYASAGWPRCVCAQTEQNKEEKWLSTYVICDRRGQV